MDIDDKDISALIRACERDLDDPDLWRNPGGYPSSLALCVIDAIHSSASHYSAVVGIVGKYRTHRTRCGADPDLDGATDLAATFAEARQTSRWAIQMAPHGSTSVTAAAARKAEAVALLVDALLRADIDTTADLRAAATAPNTLATVERLWRAIPGQRSGTSWVYAKLLARVPGATADRMITRYVTRAVGCRPGSLGSEHCAQLMVGLAEAKGCNATHLEHAIWRYESGRPYAGSPDRQPHHTRRIRPSPKVRPTRQR